MPENNNLLFAFGITLFAGLSTVVGSLFACYTTQTNKKFLSAALGVSAGVMIYVSMIEIFPEARASLTLIYGAKKGYWVTTLAFFAGIALIAIIDLLVPSADNPHEIQDVDDSANDANLLRIGLFSALAVAIHNFPEGLATFVSAIQDPKLGLSIAIAIAIHNIPEGIAISCPVYFATGDRKKAVLYSLLSGFAEPIGAVVGYFLLLNFLSDAVFGITFAGVAGIMVYISLDELLPTAEKYGEHHIAILGLVSGMAVMALSLLLFS
ncbi:MAG TPA: zinc transporter ZupT [Oscillospiraceae bacterium]|nr:zinc transporter ZupT [Oscillospiraceae bacterium]